MCAALFLKLIPENLLRESIKFIFSNHCRLRQIIAAMSGLLAAGAFASPLAEDTAPEVAKIRNYLVNDLPIHAADEEEGLFPYLAQHCPEDEDTKQIFANLHQEYMENSALLPSITAGLDDLLAGRAVAKWALFAASATRLMESQRWHIIRENNIILPLARRHFTVSDMAARRNIDFPT
jgi:hemerythrin-like domain-containing protein